MKTKLKKVKSKAPKLWSLTKTDAEFSKFIRARDGKCMRCGSLEGLTCSHFWVRQHKSVRFDPDNCIALCWPCHSFHFEKEKQGAYRDFMLNWLGTAKYNILEKKARSSYPQRDAIMDCMSMLGFK